MKQKQRLRLFKMTEIERNMLVKALYDIRGSDGREASEVECLIRKTAEAPDRRLYLTEPDYHWSMRPSTFCETPISQQDGAATGSTTCS